MYGKGVAKGKAKLADKCFIGVVLFLELLLRMVMCASKD
jgi:hypothetical protein